MISGTRYRALRKKIDLFESEHKRLYPRALAFNQEMLAKLPPDATNKEKSAVEVYEFVHDPPDRYFAYVNEKTNSLNTWTGVRLGTVTFGTPYRAVFGDTRVPIGVKAINGLVYHGTYYKSAGDYARIRLTKQSERQLESSGTK